MSSQRGNVARTRPQKHKNRTVFKNDRHDTNIRTKRINQIQITHVCDKCKAIIEWKIKYKKYKLLKAPKSCNKCGEKAVKQPYHTICQPCSDRLSICPKCTEPFRRKENTDEVNSFDAQNISDSVNSFDPNEEPSSHSEDSFSDTDDECADEISKIALNS